MPKAISLALCFFAFSLLFGQNRKGKDHALFFAVEDYRSNSDFQDLKYPIDEITELEKKSRSSGACILKIRKIWFNLIQSG